MRNPPPNAANFGAQDIAEVVAPATAVNAASISASESLFSLLYTDLHRLASSRLRQAGDLTQLNTTDLLHESFLRLRNAAPASFPDKQHPD